MAKKIDITEQTMPTITLETAQKAMNWLHANYPSQRCRFNELHLAAGLISPFELVELVAMMWNFKSGFIGAAEMNKKLEGMVETMRQREQEIVKASLHAIYENDSFDAWADSQYAK